MELRFRNKDLKIQISKSFSPKECMKLEGNYVEKREGWRLPSEYY